MSIEMVKLFKTNIALKKKVIIGDTKLEFIKLNALIDSLFQT